MEVGRKGGIGLEEGWQPEGRREGREEKRREEEGERERKPANH